MPESPTLVDQLFHLLEQLLIPNWTDLISLIPWIFVFLVIGYLIFTAMQWRRAAAYNRPRLPRRLASGSPPPGVHVSAPSRWPFVLPIGAFVMLLAFIPTRDALGNVTVPFHPPILAVGLLITVGGVIGWLREAMREWRATAQGGHGPALAATGALVLPAGGGGSALMAVQGAHVAVARAGEEPLQLPEGVHLPGPSPWPFFAPLAIAVILLGVIFSAVLIVGGIILGVIAAAGWLMDAGREYRTAETLGHPAAATLDPERVWPRRLVPVYVGVIAVSFLITLAPVGLNFLNGLKPAAPGATPIAVPDVPEVAASSPVSFETNSLVVPCCRDFDLIFHNNNAGVQHNVQIADSPARTTILFDGAVVTGAADATYHVPQLAAGDYYFLCKIHPNMNGTIHALAAGGGAPGPSPKASAP